MLFGLILIALLLTVPLLGGRLTALGELTLRMPGMALAGIGLQVLIISVLPTGPVGFHEVLHVVSYALLGACAWANRRVPGIGLVVLGGALNAVAILANGGVMPADPDLIVHAAQRGGEGFVNSGVVDSPRLLFLGDVIATPGWWLVTNVFSIGDILILCGVAVLLHRVCGSRLLAWWPDRRPAEA